MEPSGKALQHHRKLSRSGNEVKHGCSSASGGTFSGIAKPEKAFIEAMNKPME